MNIAANQGMPVTGLTPMVRNLAKYAGEAIKEAEILQRVDEILPVAFKKLSKQMKLSGDRLGKAQQEVETLNACIGELPIAVTDSFFHQKIANRS